MKRLVAVLAYGAAGLTIVVAILTPFVLFGGSAEAWFAKAVAAPNLHVDGVYNGGPTACTLERPGYRIVVNHPVVPKARFPLVPPFVQIAWTPASALPATVDDEVDVDGDGKADQRAHFAVPRDPSQRMRVDVTPLGSSVAAMHGVEQPSFGSLIARVDDRIVVRVPLQQHK